MERIVVGVDDSSGARAAVAWALREAGLRHATLDLVHAWTPPWAEGFNTEWAADRAAFEKEAEAMMAAVAADAQVEAPSDIAPQLLVVAGEAPGRALVEESASANLLVVGSRGRGGVASATLGSVSTACVHHANCPVVVVRPNPRRGEA